MNTNIPTSFKRWFAACAIVPAALAFAGCGEGERAQSARKEIKEAATATAKFAAEKRDEFVAGAEKTYDELNVKIDQLADKVVAMTGDTRTAAEKRLDELKAARAKAREELDRVKAEASEAWVEFQKSSKESLEALGKTYDDAQTALSAELETAKAAVAEADAAVEAAAAATPTPEPTATPKP